MIMIMMMIIIFLRPLAQSRRLKIKQLWLDNNNKILGPINRPMTSSLSPNLSYTLLLANKYTVLSVISYKRHRVTQSIVNFPMSLALTTSYSPWLFIQQSWIYKWRLRCTIVLQT